MRAAKAKAVVLHPKAKDVEVEAKEKAFDLPPAKEKDEEAPTPKTKSAFRPVNQKGKASERPTTPYQEECSYCGIFGHQARDCRKRIYAESKKTQRQTNNSVTANQVTFDADEDDFTGFEPDDETATLFQAALNVDSDDEADSTHRDPTPLPYPA
jgi:hypothetical protein